jgi:hypothetical protein
MKDFILNEYSLHFLAPRTNLALRSIDKYISSMHTNTSNWDERSLEMRTTLNIEDALVEKASELTGIKEKTALVKLGLEALIARESARRLAKLGGTEKQLKAIPRRRIAEQ